MSEWISPKGFAAAFNWNLVLRNGNRWFDRLAATMRVKDRTEREKQLKKFDADLLKVVADSDSVSWQLLSAVIDRDARSRQFGNIVVAMLLQSVTQVQRSTDQYEQRLRNVRLALALAMYKNDEHRYPAKLADLAPKYLPEIPKDLFSGKDVIYRITDKGYLFYSVGPNGKDEQGRTYRDLPPGGDDLPVRMPSVRPDPKARPGN